MYKLIQSYCFVVPLLILLAPEAGYAQRLYGGFYTEEKISNLRNNCDKYDWARQQREAAIEKTAYWVDISDAELWAMVPGQDLPRCIDVTFDRLTDGPKSLGCLKCGEEIKKFGNYPYNPDFVNKPWKLTCPSCQAVFPTNDFGKFYQSAIDERGLFDPSKGDRSLLFNEQHPDPNDPLHTYGVDDGFGYMDENGRAHRFIGYYTWKYWGFLNDGLGYLADAFLYTGDKRYAHKAAILLDRIADVYPDMDWKPYADMGWYHSDGGTHLGKIEGSIWETVVVQKFAESYDKILSGTRNSPELYDFLKRQSERFELPNPKGSRERFVENVDRGILHTAYEAVLSRQIRGNQGMHQLTVAMCAIALNTEPTTGQWLNWLFESDGGAISRLMITQFDRDGTSDEGAPSYSLMWGRLITRLASWIADYPSYQQHDIFEDYPQFRATFLAAYRMAALGKAIPNIGDSGATGLVSNALVDPEFMATGYYYTRDPEIAIAAYRANENSAEGLGRNIYSADPDALSKEIQKIAEEADARPIGGYLMSGFGMALLESGIGESATALVSNYGRSIKHGHADLLNFDLFAFGQWLTPDHGYPEFATKWASNAEWTGSTISHNTVYVNEQPQKPVWGGHTRMFKQTEGFGVFELDGGKAYPDVGEYIRTMFLIAGPGEEDEQQNAYVVDIFRVVGGNDHVYSFHGPPGEIAVTGLALKPQINGTYAGVDIPKGVWASGFPIGYSHLYNVKKDTNPPSGFVVDWKAAPGFRNLNPADNIHLRFHSLSQSMDVALADGDPPQNKPGNPSTLAYILLHNEGKDIHSTFVSLIEPYRDSPFINSVTRLDSGNQKAITLEVRRQDGFTDFILYNADPENALHLPNGLHLSGTAAYLRVKGKEVKKAVLVNGTKLEFLNFSLLSPGPITGKVLQMNPELTGGGWLIVDQKLPANDYLPGSQITIETEGERDASYTIQDIQDHGDVSKIFCGPISFVSGYNGGNTEPQDVQFPSNRRENYIYDFQEGASFKIDVHQVWSSEN